MATIALVSCVKQKRPSSCAAKDMYTSALFLKARRYAERNADTWFILSAKYGLLDPNKQISPYEQTIKEASASQRRDWAARVKSQLHAAGILKPSTRFMWLAGMDYQRDLSKLLCDYRQTDPLRGMRIGERLSWLTASSPRVGPDHTATTTAPRDEPNRRRGESMTNEDRIAQFLAREKSRAFCDDCLSETLRIRPRQQVQQKTSRLCRIAGFVRASGACSRCGEIRVIIKATG